MRMKKKVLRFFSLVLYLLIACTLLSGKIQEEMMIQVEVSPVNTKAPHKQITRELSTRMIFTDETGDHVYEVVDGTGWENGLRIREVDIWFINAYGSVSIPGYPDSLYVTSATRQPQPGEQVQILENSEQADDRYLAIYPGSPPEALLPLSGMADTARSSQALLLTMTDAVRPFMEHRAKGMSADTKCASRIFSLTEVKQFLEQLPSVAAVLLLLAAGLVFWAHACCVSIHFAEKKVLLAIDATLILAVLFLMKHVLDGIDLPASLLPEENILRLACYRDELSLIFTSAADFPEAARDLIAAREQAVIGCKAVLRNGVLLTAAVIALESIAPWLRLHYARIGLKNKTDQL